MTATPPLALGVPLRALGGFPDGNVPGARANCGRRRRHVGAPGVRRFLFVVAAQLVAGGIICGSPTVRFSPAVAYVTFLWAAVVFVVMAFSASCFVARP